MRFSSAQSSLQSNFQAISDLTTVLHCDILHRYYTLHTCGRVVRSGRVDGMGACDPTRPTPPGPTGRGPTREGGIGTETHLTWHCRIPMHILVQYPRTIRHSGACMKVCVCVPYIAGASLCVFGSRVHRKNNSIITSYQPGANVVCLYYCELSIDVIGHASNYIPGSNKDGWCSFLL